MTAAYARCLAAAILMLHGAFAAAAQPAQDDFGPNVVQPRRPPGTPGFGPPFPIEIRLRIFIPSSMVSLVNILGVNDIRNLGCMATRVLNVDTCLFRGDGRGFSYAAGTQRVLANVVLLPGGGAREHLYFCRTHEFRPDQGAPVAGKPWWWFAPKPGATAFATRRLVAKPPDQAIVINNFIHASAVDLTIRGANPLVFGPPIDARLRVRLYYRPGEPLTADVTGTHDGFPAYELYVNGVMMRGGSLPYDPAATFLASPFSLINPISPSQLANVPRTRIPERFDGTLPPVTAECS